jgi:GT2 family glycosyltransferase
VPRVSFVVPVLNDAIRLERCLRSIRASWYAPDALEILVVDNGSQDGSADVARRFGATVLAVERAPVAELRNLAADRATGEVLAYIDADHEVVPGWVASAVETLQQPGVAAVGAAYHAPPDGTWVQRAYCDLRGRPIGRQDVEWLGSGNFAVWRTAFAAVEGFDTSLETCEDVDLCRRLRAAGHRLVSDDRLKTIHYGDPATLRELLIGEMWRGRNNLRVSFRRPLDWRSLVTAIIPVLQIALFMLILLGLFRADRGGLWLSLGSAAILCLPAWLKALRAVVRHRRSSAARIAQAFAVACVYDIGRALALMTRTAHRSRRPATT